MLCMVKLCIIILCITVCLLIYEQNLNLYACSKPVTFRVTHLSGGGDSRRLRALVFAKIAPLFRKLKSANYLLTVMCGGLCICAFTIGFAFGFADLRLWA